MSEEMLDRIYQWSMEQLWDEIVRIQEVVDEKEYFNIKHGYNIPFHIRLYFKYVNDDHKYILEYHKKGKIKVGNKIFSLYDFFDEIDKRKSSMRNILIDYYTQEENKTEGR